MLVRDNPRVQSHHPLLGKLVRIGKENYNHGQGLYTTTLEEALNPLALGKTLFHQIPYNKGDVLGMVVVVHYRGGAVGYLQALVLSGEHIIPIPASYLEVVEEEKEQQQAAK